MTSPIDAMRAARIPVTAYVRERGAQTLEELRQPILRSIITDRNFRAKDQLVSYIIDPGMGSTAASPRALSTVLSRFAADMVMTAVPLIYVRMAGVIRELKRIDIGMDDRPIIPILERRGDGYVVVADAYNSELSPREIEDVCDFFIDHVSLGGGLILSKIVPEDFLDVSLTNDFEAMANKFTQLSVQRPPSRTPVKRSVRPE